MAGLAWMAVLALIGGAVSVAVASWAPFVVGVYAVPVIGIAVAALAGIRWAARELMRTRGGLTLVNIEWPSFRGKRKDTDVSGRLSDAEDGR